MMIKRNKLLIILFFLFLIVPNVSGNTKEIDFILTSNAESPELDGNYLLVWITLFESHNYTIYEYNSYIFNINNSLNILDFNIIDQYFNIVNKSDGNYFYVIKTSREEFDVFSNCLKITVGNTNNNNINDNIMVIFWTILGISIFIILLFIYTKFKTDKEESHKKHRNTGFYSNSIKLKNGIKKFKYNIKKTSRKIKNSFFEEL